MVRNIPPLGARGHVFIIEKQTKKWLDRLQFKRLPPLGKSFWLLVIGFLPNLRPSQESGSGFSLLTRLGSQPSEPPQANDLLVWELEQVFCVFQCRFCWQCYVAHCVTYLIISNSRQFSVFTYLVPGVWRKESGMPPCSINIFLQVLELTLSWEGFAEISISGLLKQKLCLLYIFLKIPLVSQMLCWPSECGSSWPCLAPLGGTLWSEDTLYFGFLLVMCCLITGSSLLQHHLC